MTLYLFACLNKRVLRRCLMRCSNFFAGVNSVWENVFSIKRDVKCSNFFAGVNSVLAWFEVDVMVFDKGKTWLDFAVDGCSVNATANIMCGKFCQFEYVGF